jgi:hypothetical protein
MMNMYVSSPEIVMTRFGEALNGIRSGMMMDLVMLKEIMF